MRRAILAEFLGPGALYLFCSRDAVVFDCYMPADSADLCLSADIAEQFESDKIKYAAVKAAFFTSDQVSEYWRGKLGESNTLFSSSISDRFAAGSIQIERISDGGLKNCIYNIFVDGVNILVAGSASPESILKSVSTTDSFYESVFLSYEAALSARLIDIAVISKAKKIFIYNFPEISEKTEQLKTEKHIEKLKRKHINIRIITSYPTGIII